MVGQAQYSYLQESTFETIQGLYDMEWLCQEESGEGGGGGGVADME